MGVGFGGWGGVGLGFDGFEGKLLVPPGCL